MWGGTFRKRCGQKATSCPIEPELKEDVALSIPLDNTRNSSPSLTLESNLTTIGSKFKNSFRASDRMTEKSNGKMISKKKFESTQIFCMNEHGQGLWIWPRLLLYNGKCLLSYVILSTINLLIDFKWTSILQRSIKINKNDTKGI